MSDDLWEEAKLKYPIGCEFVGTVIKVETFGLFVDTGYGREVAKVPTGIVEFVGEGSLPLDRSLWPMTGQKVKCKVISYRDRTMEIDLAVDSIVND